ncbi:MAG: PQQ-binding-like beta-propeller repeat protein [Methanobacteriaceae archaeon]
MFKIKNVLWGILIFSLIFASISGITGAEENETFNETFEDMDFNWLMFQGNSFHTGFLKEAGVHVPNVWAFGLGSPIKSTPVIKNENIYVISENGLLKSIDMETGTENWDYQFEGDVTASLVLKNNTVFVASHSGHIYAYNVKDKKLEWKFNTESSIKSTPIINGDNIYFGADNGKVYSLKVSDGSKNWESDIGGEIRSSPTIDTGSSSTINSTNSTVNEVSTSNTLFIGSNEGVLSAIDIATGDVIWNYTAGDVIESSPAIYDGKVFFGSDDGTLYTLAAKNGSLIWKYDLGAKISSSPLIDTWDNNVFIGADNGNITCLDIRDGSFKWARTTGASIKSTPALNNDTIVFGSNDGNAYILNKFTGNTELQYNPGTLLFNSPITASPIIYGDSIFIAGNDGYLYSIKGENKETPTSIFVYYVIAILVALIVAIIGIRTFIKRRAE